jgi:small subunit ribosomal protein S8
MTDPIADYLTRIRNAIRARHKKVDIPGSNLKRNITQLLLNQKYVSDFAQLDDVQQGVLRIHLKYQHGQSVITGLKRISKPGLRVYVDADHLPKVLNGLGMAVISTPKGLLTDAQARQQHVGGEVLCYIW